MLKKIIKKVVDVFSNPIKEKINEFNIQLISQLNIKNKIKEMSIYESNENSYTDSIMKYFNFNIVEFDTKIICKEEEYFLLNIDNNLISVLVEKINDYRIDIKYISDYSLSLILKDNKEGELYFSSKNPLFDLINDNEHEYFYIDGDDIKWNDYILNIVSSKYNDIESISKITLIDEKMNIYYIGDYRIVNNDYYLVWSKFESPISKKVLNKISNMKKNKNYKEDDNFIKYFKQNIRKFDVKK